MNMKVENEVTLPTTKLVTVMLLEPYAGKLARTVLRGESSRKGADLLDIGEIERPFFLQCLMPQQTEHTCIIPFFRYFRGLFLCYDGFNECFQ